jgi:hypothetical protein
VERFNRQRSGGDLDDIYLYFTGCRKFHRLVPGRESSDYKRKLVELSLALGASGPTLALEHVIIAYLFGWPRHRSVAKSVATRIDNLAIYGQFPSHGFPDTYI